MKITGSQDELGKVPCEEIDVLVAGAAAGLVAAMKAAETGAKVICFDKLGPMDAEKIIPVAPAGFPGGWGNCTAKSGGIWNYLSNMAPDKPALARIAGGTEKGEMMEYEKEITSLERYRVLSRGRGDGELARTLMDRAKADAQWLREKVGLLQKKASGVTEGKTTMGRHILPDLYEAAAKRGVKLLFEHKALKLLTDHRGRVIGIRVMTPAGLKDFKAKATILATGSFEGSHEMKLKYLGPEKAYMLVTGCPTNTGDGLKMAMEMGAKVVNMNATHIRTTDAVVYGRGPSRCIPDIYARGVYINKAGKRFVNECRESDDIANTIAHQPDQKVYLVFDEKVRSKFAKQYENYISNTIRDASRPTTEDELMIKAGTIEELADQMGVSCKELKTTLEEFNAAVKDGKALGIPHPKVPRTKEQDAVRVDQPPFYAHPITCGLNHPLGGLKINTKGQVMNDEDKIIPGLYACGALVNVHFGETVMVEGEATYISSYFIFAGLGYSFTTGCLAGENAAMEAHAS